MRTPPEQIPPIRCPDCQSDLYDNRPSKLSGRYASNAPDFRCKNRNACDWAYWLESATITRPASNPTPFKAPHIPAPSSDIESAWSQGVGMFQRAQAEAVKLLGLTVSAEKYAEKDNHEIVLLAIGIMLGAIQAGAAPPVHGRQVPKQPPPAPAKTAKGSPPEIEDDWPPEEDVQDEEVPF